MSIQKQDELKATRLQHFAARNLRSFSENTIYTHDEVFERARTPINTHDFETNIKAFLECSKNRTAQELAMMRVFAYRVNSSLYIDDKNIEYRADRFQPERFSTAANLRAKLLHTNLSLN